MQLNIAHTKNVKNSKFFFINFQKNGLNFCILGSYQSNNKSDTLPELGV